MQWPHLATYLFAFAFSGLSGIWFYLITRRKWHWQKVVVAFGFSSSSGLAIAMLMSRWFDLANDAEFVIGLCGAGGLCGFNVETLKHYLRIVLLAVLKGNGNGSDNGPRDVDNPWAKERPSD